MLMSIATVSVSGGLESKLRAIAAARFDGVEIFENDLLTFGGTARDVRQLMGELKLACTLFQPFRDFEGMPEPQRARAFERMERKFDLMQELGAPLLLVCSNVSPLALADRARIVADFQELGERAAARGLKVGYEALAWGRHVSDHRDAWDIVRSAAHPAVGLILDSFHSLARDIPIDSLRSIDAAKIFLVQLADAPRLQMDPLSWSRHFRCMPGQGEFPLADYVGALIANGYTGPLSLEIFNDRFRAVSAAMVAVDGRRSLSFLQDQVARRLRPGAVPLESLAPRGACRGVEFLEFAANEAEVPQLEHLFRGLGFAETGRHRSKDVRRWQQNGINFVINCEPDSFARDFDMLHGASVCALGLRLVDVDSTLRRAAQLQIPRHSQPLESGDLQVPALQSVGGGLLYCIEDGSENELWEREFQRPAEAARGAQAGLLRVDHISQTMQYDELLSWLLFYVSLFEVGKSPQLEIPDPLGLVYSQAVENADRSFCVMLNASASADTLASRFLHGYMGAGVQSIALVSSDIMHTARQLRANGLPLLPIPRNYYDDLQARFDLDARRLEELAEHNVLYDRDGDGEYYQLYTRAFAKRFFFEIVQRRDYNAYGVVNAAVRMAAQSRYRQEPAA